MNMGKQGADLCSSSLTQHFVSQYFREGHWEPYLASLRGLYRGRRDTLLGALAEHFPAEATWTQPEGGLFVGGTPPPEIDTPDLLARALQSNVAFVPGRGAYLDGRGGNSMRLNFSGVGDADIREGVRRIGEVIGEQLELFRALTGARPAPAAPEREAEAPG